MRLPRDLGGAQLAGALRVLGYVVTRQKGSHLRVTTQLNGEHHETIPNHQPLKLGTSRNTLRSVAVHHALSLEEVLRKLGL